MYRAQGEPPSNGEDDKKHRNRVFFVGNPDVILVRLGNVMCDQTGAPGPKIQIYVTKIGCMRVYSRTRECRMGLAKVRRNPPRQEAHGTKHVTILPSTSIVTSSWRVGTWIWFGAHGRRIAVGTQQPLVTIEIKSHER